MTKMISNINKETFKGQKVLEFNKCNSLLFLINVEEAFVNLIKVFKLKRLFYYVVSINNELFH